MADSTPTPAAAPGKAAAAAPKQKGPPQALKIAGGILLVCISAVVFYKRLPERKYAEVHVDKPRPRPAAAGAAEAQAAKPAPARPAPGQPVKPAGNAPIPAPAPVTASAAVSPAEPMQESIDLAAACAPEIGILCYGVLDESVQRCLSNYEDVLLKDCRDAMESLKARAGSSSKKAEPAVP